MPPDLKDVVVEERIICDLYRDGLSIAKIANQLGRHQHYISRILKRNHVQIRKHAWVRIKPAYTNLRDEIIRRWGDNQPIANIASSLDMSVMDVRAIVESQPIKQGEQKRIAAKTNRLILSWMAAGDTARTIAEKCHVSVEYVRHVIANQDDC